MVQTASTSTEFASPARWRTSSCRQSASARRSLSRWQSSSAWPSSDSASLFALTFALFITKHRHRFSLALLSLNLSVLNFLVLSFGAVIFGARTALSNNGIFIAALLGSWIIIYLLHRHEQDA